MTNHYEQKQERRRERLQGRAERKRAEGENRLGAAHETASHIPMGQPILVGHHSERRHRRAIERIQSNTRKGIEAHREAKELDRRADAVGSAGVSSDDPEAVDKLRALLTEREARQDLMKAANRAVRLKDTAKGDAKIRELGLDPETLREPDALRRVGFPDYALKNNNAQIRRLKQRIADLEAAAEDETTEREAHGVTVVDSVEDNRLQLFFPGKPSDAVRAQLKAHGFRWARSVGAWQRHRSNAADYAANLVLETYADEVAS